MIRLLLITLFSLGFARGEEPSLADLVPDLSADEFKVRKTAMGKIQAYTKAHPKRSLKELPSVLKKIDDPEGRLRLREIAKDLINFKTTKSLFGFMFSLNKASLYKEAPVTGILLSYVLPNSPTQRDGLRIRDTILALNGKPFPGNLSEEEIRKIFADQVPGKKVALVVLRLGKIIELKVSPRSEPLEPEIAEQRRREFEDWLRGGAKD